MPTRQIILIPSRTPIPAVRNRSWLTSAAPPVTPDQLPWLSRRKVGEVLPEVPAPAPRGWHAGMKPPDQLPWRRRAGEPVQLVDSPLVPRRGWHVGMTNHFQPSTADPLAWRKRVRDGETFQLVPSPLLPPRGWNPGMPNQVQPPPPPPPVFTVTRNAGRIPRTPDATGRLKQFSEKVSTLLNSLIGRGYIRELSPATEFMILSGAIQTDRAPAATDDESVAINPGNIWVNTLTDDFYINLHNDLGAAVWAGPIGSGGAGPAGPPGPTGPTGPTGPSGVPGLYFADLPPVSGTANDDEFDNGVVGAAWTEIDTGSNLTVTEGNYGLKFVQAGTPSDFIAALVRTQAAGDFAIVAKLSFSAVLANFGQVGIFLANNIIAAPTTAPFRLFNISVENSAAVHVRVEQWTNTLTFAGNTIDVNFFGLHALYMRVRRISTTLHYDISTDGLNWSEVVNEAEPFTIAQVGFGIQYPQHTGQTCACYFRFFRYQTGTALDTPLLGQGP